MKHRFTSRVATTLTLAALLAPAGLFPFSSAAEPAGAASDGIATGVYFRLPMLVGGKPVNGKAIVGTDKILTVFYVSAGEVEGPIFYLLARQDVGPIPPVPTPPVPPVPPVPPTPIVKARAVYLIHESGDDGQPFAAIRNARAWKTECDKLGLQWLLFDKDSGAKKFPSATKRALDKGLPAVVILDKDGAATVEKCPATPEAMLALVKRAGGAK
jgi:hypothetical protein